MSSYIGYNIMTCFFRFMLNIFFKNIIIEGNVPDDVPVIIACNHRNALIDGMMLTSKTKRIMHLMTKATLFKNKFLRFLFRTCHAIPVHRRQDQINNAHTDNTLGLSEAVNTLLENKCFGIFPEGMSHSDTYIHELKKGIAHIAIDAAKRGKKIIYIVPTGINYIDPSKFRSDCIIKHGEPIMVTHESNVDNLMADINNELSKVTISTKNKEDMDVMDMMTNIYLSHNCNFKSNEYINIKKTIINKLTGNDICQKTSDYIQKLKQSNFTDEIIRYSTKNNDIFMNIINFIFGMILIIPSIIINFPIIMTVMMSMKYIIKEDTNIQNAKLLKVYGKDMAATIKILSVLVSGFLMYTIASCIILNNYNLMTLIITYICYIIITYVGILGYDILSDSHYCIGMFTKNIIYRNKIKEIKILRENLREEISRLI